MKAIFLAAAILAQTALAGSFFNATTDSLEVVTTSTSNIDYSISYIDYTSSTATPTNTSGAISSATTTTVLTAPAAAHQYELRRLNLRNTGTTPNTLTLQKDISGTNRVQYQVTLGASETLVTDSEGDLFIFDAAGVLKTAAANNPSIGGMTLDWYKVGAVTEAASLFQGMAKDTGFPSAWVPGAPGVNGDALDCSIAADAVIAGAPLLSTPASGSWYLTALGGTATVVALPRLVDLVWYNTGLVVTTTTAQTFTPPTLGNRDNLGGATGEGWQLGIYVTGATTNGTAVTNMTASYTNSDGTAGQTATIASFPATAVAGVFVPFQLQAGDRGVRTIASVTLGTSLVGGAVSIVLYRTLASFPVVVVNTPATLQGLNTRIFNGTCFWPQYFTTATTATTLTMQANLVVK